MSLSKIDIEIIYRENIPYNVKINQKFLHSHYNPYKEAERKWSVYQNYNATSFLLIKVGLGYIVDFIIKQPFSKMYWYEPNLKIKQAALERLKQIPFFSEKWINTKIFFINEFDIHFIKNMESEILFTEVFFLNIPDYIQNRDLVLIDLILRKKKLYQINQSTLNKFESTWISNLYKNFVYLKRFIPIDILKNQFINYPLVIVAGGPSLDKWLSMIKRFYNKFLIISVDTAVSSLVENDIIPDFVLSVDAQKINYLHLQKFIKKYQFKLICDPLVYFLTVKNYLSTHEQIIIFNHTFPTTSLLYKKIFNNFSFLKSGGSVATTALDFSYYVGANPIFIVGLDLSFPNRLIHSRFSILENYMYFKVNRLFTREFINYKQLTAIPRKYLYDKTQNILQTNDKLLVFKEWFEKNYNVYKDREIYLLYGGGVLLRNYSFLSEDEFINMIKLREDIDRNIILQYNSEIYFDPLSILKEIYKNFIKINQHLLDLIKFIDDYLLQKNEYTLKMIHELEDQLLKYEELKFIFFSEINKLNYVVGDIKENVILSKEIYRVLLEKLRFHLESLEKTMGISHNLA